MKTGLAKLANHLYDHVPGVHRSLYVLYKQWSDRAERSALAEWVRPGMTVLDVGANIGVYTEFLARLVGPTGKVVAFEPEQRNVERLKRATFHISHVEIVHAAVCDKPGHLRLFVASDLNVDHRTYDAGDKRPFVEVPAITLDDFLPSSQVDFIKMDIQGAELGALRGAQRVLTRGPRLTMLLEYWPYGLSRAGERPAEMIEFLQRNGFNVMPLGFERMPELDLADPDAHINLIAART